MTEHVSGSDTEPAILHGALALLEAAGLPIVPAFGVHPDGRCRCSAIDCGSPGKHPRFKAWQRAALRDPEAIRKHWQQFPFDGFGIPTGQVSGVVVLDVDGPEGEATLAELERLHGALPRCPTVVTSRGRHLYFAAGSVPLHNRAGASGRGLGSGLDLRGENGFAVCPPSKHASGVHYAWAEGLHVGQVAPPAVVQWIVDAAAERPRQAQSAQQVERVAPASVEPASALRVERWAAAALQREVANVVAAREGTRNDTLNTAAFNAGTIVGGGALEAGLVRQALLGAALACGLGETEAQATIASGLAAGMAKPRSAPSNGSNGSNGHAHAVEPRAASASSSASFEPEGPSAPDVQPLNTSDAHQTSRIEIIDTTQIFEPLPAQRWAVPGLQLGPGRPTLIVGYGASAKSISTQALALAAAAGRPIFGHFDCSPMTVLHVDFEQGETDSRLRYQRLARGMGIDPSVLEQRLHLASLPRLRLYATDKDAEVEFRRVMLGVDLVIIDSFRASSRGIDENDSDAREIIDMFTRLSLSTGAAILLIHHSNKPTGDRDRDVRAAVRGSSGIFDACGAVYLFDRKPGKPATRVRMIKSPSSACGGAIEPFDLLVEDVPATAGEAQAGVRVLWRAVDPTADDDQNASDVFERDSSRLLTLVAAHPGESQRAIEARSGLMAVRTRQVLAAMVEQGSLRIVHGPRGAKQFWPAEGVSDS